MERWTGEGYRKRDWRREIKYSRMGWEFRRFCGGVGGIANSFRDEKAGVLKRIMMFRKYGWAIPLCMNRTVNIKLLQIDSQEA